jgi:copper(I)-binding protein
MLRLRQLTRLAALAAGLLLLLPLVLVACGDDDDADADGDRNAATSAATGSGGEATAGDIVITDVWSRPAILLDDDDPDDHDEHDDGHDDQHDEHDDGDAGHDDHDEDADHDEHDSHDGGTNGVVYLRIENRGDEDDRLIEARSQIARAVELHTTNMVNGVMQMRQVEGGIEIPAGESVVFEQGGFHVMLIGLRQALAEGDRFEVELIFERAGTITVESEVRAE